MFDVFVQETMSKQEATALRSEMEAYGGINRIPSAWQKGLVFTNLGFEWDARTSSYRSTGTGELLTVGPHRVNKKMKVYAQITRGRRGDVINIYIEGSRYNWYYFNYSDHVLQVISSDQGFNEALEKIKAGKRRKGKFQYALSTMRKKNIFVTEFEDYGGADDEEDVQETEAATGLDDAAGEGYDGYDGYEDWTDEGEDTEEGEEESAGEDGVEEDDTLEEDVYSDEDDDYWDEDDTEEE
ncbi:MAG: hypothetical protein K2K51_05125, partial [Bacteroidales bacterium]|nr:hypothetical protein [Bacteroidales bacterium]